MSVGQLVCRMLIVAFLMSEWAERLRADLHVVTDVAPVDLAGGAYNTFRASDVVREASDRTLAWFDLDSSNASTLNTADNSLSLYVNVYSDRLLTDRIGTAHASGIVLPGDVTREAASQEYLGLVAESIDWSIQLDRPSSFDRFLTRAFGDQPIDGWNIEVGETASAAWAHNPFTKKSAAPRDGFVYDRAQRWADQAGRVSFQTDVMLRMESATVVMPLRCPDQ